MCIFAPRLEQALTNHVLDLYACTCIYEPSTHTSACCIITFSFWQLLYYSSVCLQTFLLAGMVINDLCFPFPPWSPFSFSPLPQRYRTPPRYGGNRESSRWTTERGYIIFMCVYVVCVVRVCTLYVVYVHVHDCIHGTV